MDKEALDAIPEPIALIVDDEPLILMDTADLVSAAGFHVIEARSADEAYAFLKKYSSLKLLITDIQMPGKLDGIALAKHVNENWPHIQIVVASGAVLPEPGELPQSARFLGKPLDQRLVLDIIEDLKSHL